MHRFALLTALALCSCSLAVRRGNALAEQGDFMGAVSAYDEALAADPNDAEALALRDEARTQALVALLTDTQKAIGGKQFPKAASALGSAFVLADQWGRLGTGEAELNLLGTAWLDDLGRRLDAEGPLRLGEERQRATSVLTHPRFSGLTAALAAAWAQAASTRCDTMLAAAKTPFLGALTQGYCHAFGREVEPATPPLPLFSTSPRVEDFVRGAQGPWPVTLTQAFDASPWAWKGSQAHAHLKVSGQLEALYSDRPVTRTARWSVQVPYTTTRWVQVPYTTYQYYSYPCGRRLCSGSRPVTQYRTQPQTVTAYRTERRSLDYAATESIAELTAQVNLFVDLSPHAKGLGTVLSEQTVETGLTHSGVAQAGVPPSTARLPSKSEWDARMRKAAHDRLLKALVEHWRDAWCNPPLADAEAAARCAFAGDSSPEARALLDPLFKDELSTLLAPPRFGLQ